MLKKYGKYPILKISNISDIFELDIYMADMYHANPASLLFFCVSCDCFLCFTFYMYGC